MKATLYEALGIPQAASDEEVRAALRRLIRKYYAKTRDGQGNVEEALRFINHASRLLSDPGQRQRYDQELAVTTEATTEQRIAHFHRRRHYVVEYPVHPEANAKLFLIRLDVNIGSSSPERVHEDDIHEFHHRRVLGHALQIL